MNIEDRRALIAEQTKEFLRSGGRIQRFIQGATGIARNKGPIAKGDNWRRKKKGEKSYVLIT